jgi:hypothetical protein
MRLVGHVRRPLLERVYSLDRLLQGLRDQSHMQAQLLRQLQPQVLQPQDLVWRLWHPREHARPLPQAHMPWWVPRRTKQLLMAEPTSILIILAGMLSGYAAAWSP